MKVGDKFCGYGGIHSDYFELEVLEKCVVDSKLWVVHLKKPDYGWEKYVRMTKHRIENMLKSSSPASLGNV